MMTALQIYEYQFNVELNIDKKNEINTSIGQSAAEVYVMLAGNTAHRQIRCL
jgi:hypothetical protein